MTAFGLPSYTIYIQSMSSNDTPNELSQTQAEHGNGLICLLPQLTDFQCSIMQVTSIELLTASAAIYYVNMVQLERLKAAMSLSSQISPFALVRQHWL